uniref:Uncharacterized protein n=1 Tax=viral metagenome TaxID=1070528 RepID=A0A6C0BQD8_9ZZZZ
MEQYFWIQNNPQVTLRTFGWQSQEVANVADDILYHIAWLLWATKTTKVQLVQDMTYILQHACRLSNDPLVSGESIYNTLRENIKLWTGARKANHLLLADLHGLCHRANKLCQDRQYPPSYYLQDEAYLQVLLRTKSMT